MENIRKEEIIIKIIFLLYIYIFRKMRRINVILIEEFNIVVYIFKLLFLLVFSI